MTRLLVSVRSACEARAAIAGGADIIDVKEPARGPLGRADDDVIREVLTVAAGRAHVSAALGELIEFAGAMPHSSPCPPCLRGDNSLLLNHAPSPPGLDFVKIGLAGFIDNWQKAWRRWRGDNRQAVLVAYADMHDLAEFVAFANEAQPAALLIDTATKDGKSLFDYVPSRHLARLIQQCDVSVALAGSLTMSTIDEALSTAPAIVAVRGAACRGGRLGTIEAIMVRTISTRLARFAAAG